MSDHTKGVVYEPRLTAAHENDAAIGNASLDCPGKRGAAIFKGETMSEVYQSLAHSRWDCKYHDVIFVSKRRQKVLYCELRRQLSRSFLNWPVGKESQILERNLQVDHVHMVTAIPQVRGSDVIGFLKDKLRMLSHVCKERDFSGKRYRTRATMSRQ